MSRLTSAADADGEVVWSWRPDAGAKFAEASFCKDDGGKKAGHRGEHEVSRKTICAGKAGLPPLDLYARVRFLLHYCTRDRG